MAQSTERIINGKQYDIETAQFLGQWDNGYYHRTDLEWFCMTLHRKEDGEYFLLVEGNDYEELRAQYGKHFYDGEIIIPVTEEKAREWALCYLTENQNLRIFGVVYQDRKQIVTWVDKSIKNRANALIHDKDYTIQEIIAAGVEALENKAI